MATVMTGFVAEMMADVVNKVMGMVHRLLHATYRVRTTACSTSLHMHNQMSLCANYEMTACTKTCSVPLLPPQRFHPHPLHHLHRHLHLLPQHPHRHPAVKVSEQQYITAVIFDKLYRLRELRSNSHRQHQPPPHIHPQHHHLPQKQVSLHGKQDSGQIQTSLQNR